jgi:L-iditol 2-dehydrogenase
VPETMAALRKLGAGGDGVALADVPVPHPGPGQVRIEVGSAGICGTDLHIVDDEFRSVPPVTMGHEVSGVIDEVGEGVDQSHLGRLVALETYYSTCGRCARCRSGQPNLCADRRSIGSFVDGGFARYVVVPLANAHDVDASVDPRAASLYEPLACVAHCLCDPSVVSPGDRALVVGPGSMGLLAAQVLRAEGAAVTIVGTERDSLRLALADQLGLHALVDQDLAAAVPPLGFDVVVDCSGAAAGVGAALEHVRKGGRYVQVGLCGRPVLVDLDAICLKELTVTSGFASTPASWARAERLVAAGLVRLDPLVSGVAALEDWQELFARTRQAGAVKLVLDPRMAS